MISTERLSDEQIADLLQEYLTTKNVQVRDRVILQYKNLVESIARRFAGSGEPIEDLIQEGYIGLITATDGYNADKGVKFSTYATHFIIGQIKHSLRDRGKIIKEPAWLQELNYKMARVIDSLYQELGRQPTEEEIGRVMHLPEEQVADLLTTREIFKVTSLDYGSSDQDDNSSSMDVDKVKDDKCVTFQLPVEDKVVLETAMNKLKLIEQKVIQEFFYTGLSQTEIARKLGISCNYVSHILRNGTRKLRRILTTEEIMEMQVQLQLASRRSEGAVAEAEAPIADALTGLYNRRYIEGRLDEELLRAARSRSQVTFALFIVDDLDQYASSVGTMKRDDAVFNLAQIVKDCVRRCDIVGRFEDGSFALILPHTGKQSAKVCERVRSAMSDVRFETGRSRGTVSFSVRAATATYPNEGASAQELMDFAFSELESEVEQLRKAA